MADRSPPMTLIGSSQSLVLVGLLAPDPAPSIQVARVSTDRVLRDSGTGSAKLKRVFRPFDTSNLTIPVSIPFCDQPSYTKLRTMVEGNPPDVAVTYLHLTSVHFDLADLTPVPDLFWWDIEQTHAVSFTLRGKSQ